MMFRFKLLSLIILSLFAFFIFAPKTSAEDLFEDACKTGAAQSSPACQQVQEQKASGQNPIAGPDGILQQVANVFALVAAVGGTILIVYGGYVFVTAGGSIGGQRATDSPTRARQARSIITSALTGMVIVAFAWLIVTFINTRIIG
ncbi:MAG: hypothetical protein UX30_C0003G0027 [Candidatus Saccharibacteria bacterium GW2011_GWA2_46_10]|nr:MAG: hypothetical protein UX30_C0003G0027 [Candidatus Saccharibacteria bacterium GW2011_GWA2_46_10]